MKNGPTHEFPYNWPTFKERDELKERERERERERWVSLYKIYTFYFFPYTLEKTHKIKKRKKKEDT